MEVTYNFANGENVTVLVDEKLVHLLDVFLIVCYNINNTNKITHCKKKNP